MKKHLLILVVLMLGAITGYSQMIYNEKGELVEKELRKIEKKQPTTNVSCACEVFLKSGESVVGNILFSLMTSKKVKVYTPEGKVEVLKNSDIVMLRVMGNHQTYDLIHTEWLEDKSKGKGKLSKLSARTFNELEFKKEDAKWMLIVKKGKANLYLSAVSYCFDVDGELAPVVKEGTRPSYYGAVEGRDELPVLVYGHHKYFLGIAPAFFEGHPISEKIRNQEEVFNYGYDGNLARLFDLYNEDN